MVMISEHEAMNGAACRVDAPSISSNSHVGAMH
jgi:hypothetical protein